MDEKDESRGRMAANREKRRKAREDRMWVAWSGDLSRIVARGTTLEEARDAAMALGEIDPAMEMEPRPNRIV